jgi:SAM-dependent methyltransferase
MNTFAPAHLGARYRGDSPEPSLSSGQAAVRRRLLEQDRGDDWESVTCLCGAEGGRVLTEVDRYGLPYRKVLCPACGLMRVTPRWTAARYARFYADDYRDLYSPLSGPSGADTLRGLAAGAGARLVGEFVESAWARFGDPSRERPVIVEIGAGGGWNLSRLPSRWVRIGYDYDERFLQLGRELFGIDMRRGFMSEALAAVGEADCVLLSHVLEHVPDPVDTLRQLCAAARADTLILVEVPGIFRLHKTSLDPMRYWQNAHTFTFCARTAVDTCRRAGLEPLSVDEWIRVVLRPSAVASGPVVGDPLLARSTERYLRYCEASHRLSVRVARWPLVGAPLARLVRRGADALVRAAAAMGLIHGMQGGR